MNFNVIKTLKKLILNFGGKTYTVDRNSTIGKETELLLKNGSPPEEIEKVIDFSSYVTKTFDELSFDIDDTGQIYIDNELLPKCIADRLHNYSELDVVERVKAIILFWKNCKLNPDDTARTDLFAFLSHNSMPITSDGCFIGYKYVTRLGDKLVDAYTQRFDYSIGQKPKMRREDCDSDRYNPCSRGLHVGALSYVNNHKTENVIISVKVNPKDVVAIPIDYNQTKLRCCEFESLEILNGEVHETNIVNNDTQFISVVDTSMVW